MEIESIKPYKGYKALFICFKFQHLLKKSLFIPIYIVKS